MSQLEIHALSDKPDVILCGNKCDLEDDRAVGKKVSRQNIYIGYENNNVGYRVTIPLVQNLPLTTKQKFRFDLGRPGEARPKRNFCFEVNRRF